MESELNKLHDRLRTWSALTPHEIPIVQSASTNVDDQLNSTNSRIASLKAELDALEVQKSSLSQLSNAYHSLLSPIRSLPIELLSEIFFHCDIQTVIKVRESKEDRYNSSTGMESHIEAPSIVLCKVCKTWNTVLSLPTSSFAWSKISISLTDAIGTRDEDDYVEPLNHALRSFENAVKRAGNSPLHITIRYSNVGRWDHPNWNQCLYGLFLNCHRWQTAILYLAYNNGSGVQDWEVVDYLSSSMPLLQDLDLVINNEHRFDEDDSEVGTEPFVFSTSPMLRHVVLNGTAFSRTNLPYHQLHSLHVHNRHSHHSRLFSLYHVSTILSQCSPSLTDLTWTCPVRALEEESEFDTRVNLPNVVLSGDVHLLSILGLLLVKMKDQVIKVELDLRRPRPDIDYALVDDYQLYITHLRICMGHGSTLEKMVARTRNCLNLQTLEVEFDDLKPNGQKILEDSISQVPDAFTNVKTFSCEVKCELSEDTISDVLSLIKMFQRLGQVESRSPVLRVVELKFRKGQLVEKHLQILRDFKAQGLRLTVIDQTELLVDI